MPKRVLLALALIAAGSPLSAQDLRPLCITPDSIAVSGNKRVAAATIVTDAGLVPKTQLNAPTVSRAIKNVFQSGQFDDVDLLCRVTENVPPVAIIVIKVVERPILDGVGVTGTSALSQSTVQDKVGLLLGRPVDPAQVARDVQRIDSTYQAAGYFARIKAETTLTAGGDHASIMYRVDEGHRLAISGIRVTGNRLISAKTIAGAMQTTPEKFFFWQKGEFDPDKYAQDIGEKIPQLYASRGLIDFQLAKDTLLIDRERGKGLVDLQVNEGTQYKVGSFEATGNRRFSNEDIKRFNPFTGQAPSLQQRLTSLVRGKPINTGVF